MNILKKTLTSLALASAILVAPVTHAAALINGSFVDGINTLQDSNADRVLRADGNGGYNVLTTGAFQVGDTLQAILRFDSVNSAAINGAVGTLNYGLWAYSEIKIDTLSAASPGVINVTFTAANILSAGGSMVEIYEANSGDNFLTLGADAGISAVRALTPVATFGLADTDDFWSASLPTLISNLDQPLGSGQQPSGAFGLTTLTNSGLLPIETNGILSGTSGELHDVIGDVSAFPRETGVNGDWIVSTNTNISFNKATVPEPSNIALLGLGLLGLSMRRQKKAK